MPHPRDLHVFRIRDIALNACINAGEDRAMIGGQRLQTWTDGVFSVVALTPGSPLQVTPKWAAVDVFERGERRFSANWRDDNDPACTFFERSEYWLARFLNAMRKV